MVVAVVDTGVSANEDGFFKLLKGKDFVDGDLVHTTDFRTVYAGVLERWFGVESEPILGARYDALQGFLT